MLQFSVPSLCLSSTTAARLTRLDECTLCCRKQFTDLREGHVDEGLDKMQSSLVEAVRSFRRYFRAGALTQIWIDCTWRMSAVGTVRAADATANC